MKKGILYIGYIAISFVLLACHGKRYTLTIIKVGPGGENNNEVHTINAENDSAAYVKGTTLYLLSLHAYRKMSDNAKPFISKPKGFHLVDESANNIDSLLGKEKAGSIKNNLDTLIN